MTALPELQLRAAATQQVLDGRSTWRHRAGVIAIAVPGVLALLVAVLGPFLAPHGVSDLVGPPLSGPGPGLPLGTDYLGHDVLSRVLHGGRTLVLLPLVATLTVSGLGTMIGIVSGYLQGRLDRAVVAVLDVLLALPWLLVLLVCVSGWGSGAVVLVCAVVLTGSPFVARVARAATLQVTHAGYVEQARALGEPLGSILLRVILPNMAAPLLADAGLRLVASLYLVATASFLGFGLQPPRRRLGPDDQRERQRHGADPVGRGRPGGADRGAGGVREPARRSSRPPAGAMTAPIVEVNGLTVQDGTGLRVLDAVSLQLPEGASIGVVGESGSGKTTLALAMLGAVRPGLRATEGEVRVAGRPILPAAPRAIQGLRREVIAYLGQDPASTLTPSMRIGPQIAERLREGWARGPDLGARLNAVGLPGERAFQRRYPGQLSGGQQQRVALARALAADPRVLVLDEPTTGLDVVTQDLVLAEIARQRARLGLALVVISHDLAVVTRLADVVLVLQDGVCVDRGDIVEVLTAHAHPHTAALVAACADVRQLRPAHRVEGPDGGSLLEVRGLSAFYRGRGGRVVAAQDVSLAVRAGECTALVGSSGSGKTTIARCVAGLHPLEQGTIALAGEALPHDVRRRTVDQRRRIQLIPQDPLGSLNPRWRVGQSVARPLRVLHGVDAPTARLRVVELLERVRLSPGLADRYPSQLSGGQRQRVAIARALAAGPQLLLCDEITSALDTSVQAIVLDLLDELRRDLGLGLLFVTHDLGIVARVADRVVVLDHGRVCEQAPTADLLTGPEHPKTRELLSAAPSLHAELAARHALRQPGTTHTYP